MFEPIKLSFFRQIIIVVFCVLLPGFIYGILLLFGQDRAELDVGHEVARVVFLQDMKGSADAIFLNRPGEFEDCVRERGREFCLRLLSEKIASSLAGELGSIPDAAKRANNRSSRSDQSSPNFIAQLRYLTAGLIGITVALCCMWAGVRISAA